MARDDSLMNSETDRRKERKNLFNDTNFSPRLNLMDQNSKN